MFPIGPLDGFQNTLFDLFQTVDLNGYSLNISLQDGTYDLGATGSVLAGALPGQASAGSVLISGGPGAIITASGGVTIAVLHSGTKVQFDGGLTIQNTGGGDCLRVADNAYVELGFVSWGQAGDTQIDVGITGDAFLFKNYNIVGDSPKHIKVQGCGGIEFYNLTCTAVGARTFSTAFIHAFDYGSAQTANVVYSGTFNGQRYLVESGGSIDPFGGGENYFPGTSAGKNKGGWYDSKFAAPQIGFGPGSGGTVTQLTSKSTAVTINTTNGTITTNNAALGANTVVSFQVNDSFVSATDTITVTQQTGTGGGYGIFVSAVVNGAFQISILNITAGPLSDAIAINFNIMKVQNS